MNKRIVIIGGAMIMATSALAQTTQSKTQRLFLTSGTTQRMTLSTPWRQESVRWRLTSDAGVVKRGTTKTDDNGRINLSFKLPSVRSPVRLQWTGKPVESNNDNEDVTRRHLWLLPSDPFADVRGQLERLTVNTRLSAKLDQLMRAQPVNVSPWEPDADIEGQQPTIAVTEYPRRGHKETVGRMLTTLPKGSIVIVINRPKAKGRRNLLRQKDEPAEDLRGYADKPALIWRDLEPNWFTAPLDRRLTIKGQYVSFRLLGGWIDNKERIYPLAMTACDRNGRRILMWNLADAMRQDDPRWALLLRNSLLWAKQKQPPASTD